MSETAPDRLTVFLDWWLAHRIVNPPFDSPAMFDGQIWGAVLYRARPWQVQLFILKPGSVVPEHRHPHVDSYEVFLAGDIEFTVDEDVELPMSAGELPGFDGHHVSSGRVIRVTPDTWHGARTGAKGGVFLSVQHWLEGEPSNVGDDWQHRQGESRRNHAAA